MGSPHLVADCPRCGTKSITFDTKTRNQIGTGNADWQLRYEVPAKCRQCGRMTIWVMQLSKYDLHGRVADGRLWALDVSLNDGFENRGYVSPKDSFPIAPPEHIPSELEAVFREAATCKAVNCPNASVAMSRLCLDIVTKILLPSEEDASCRQPNRDERKKLFDRLAYLFEVRILPDDLKELADAIREHGNDGVHDGACQMIDAEDLLDFTVNVLERVYTVPERAKAARQRVRDRRTQ